jgi:uncharacterized protein (TIGR02172 family)
MNQISPNKLIARGRTADVYEWDAGHVLKIFHDWFDMGNIKYEQRIARAVHASGVKSPVAGEIIQVDGHTGLIYERVAGESMARMCLRKPWKAFAYAKVLAQLHAQMHNCLFHADVPEQRSRIQSKINDAQALSVALKTRLLSAVAELPEGDRVCHGDLHPENVLISDQESTVIDWIDASRGNPLADVARTSVILLGAAESEEISNPFLKIFVKTFHSLYRKQYFRLRPGGENEYRQWLPIVAGARLSENITEIESWLVKQAQSVR